MPYETEIFQEGSTWVAVYRLPTQKQMEDEECPLEIWNRISYEDWIESVCGNIDRIPLLLDDEKSNDTNRDTADDNPKKRPCKECPVVDDTREMPQKKPRVDNV